MRAVHADVLTLVEHALEAPIVGERPPQSCLSAVTGNELDDAGEHSVKGFEEKWQLFRLASTAN